MSWMGVAMMCNSLPAEKVAGLVLRRLILENYKTQEDFSYDFGADLRTVNRYINQGINKLTTIQELAMFFKVEWRLFFDSEYAEG